MDRASKLIPAILVAGTESGVGKTTVTLAVTANLRRRGFVVQPFKVGPDFLDPQHHARVAGRPSITLDSWLVSPEMLTRTFVRYTQGADIAIVEGVMGLFDGLEGRTGAGSSAEVAKMLGLPVVLVVDAARLARSAGAVIHGFHTYDPDLRLAGVIFNRIAGARHLAWMNDAIIEFTEDEEKLPVLGGVPWREDLRIPERHLGLVVEERGELSAEAMDAWATLGEEELDVPSVLEAARTAQGPARNAEIDLVTDGPPPGDGPVMAVARDEAFSFYYEENLRLLRRAGARLVFFSPCADAALPEGTAAVYIGGGYPELHAARLAANAPMRAAVRALAGAGGPILAECGGLMYMCERLIAPDGADYPMVGLFAARTRMDARRLALGYAEVTLAADTVLGPAGTVLRGQEFHVSTLDVMPASVARVYTVRRDSGVVEPEGYAAGHVLGSYIHLHFGSNPAAAESFVAAAQTFAQRGG